MLKTSRLKRLLSGGVAVALLTSCAAVRDQVRAPEVSVGEVRVVGISLADTQIAVDLIIKNPNGFGLSVEGVSYAMQLQDKPLFDGSVGDRIRVEGGKTSKVSLPFSFRYADVLGSVGALRDQKQIRYKVSGKVDLGLFTLPYSKEGDLSAPKLPEFSLQGLKVERLSLGGVELALKLKIKNANAFPVRLGEMDYDLKLADVSLLHGRSAPPAMVGAHGDGVTSLTLKVGYAQVGPILEKLRNAKSLPVEFAGRITVPGAGEGAALPYSWSGEVPLSR